MKVLFAHDSNLFSSGADEYYSDHLSNTIKERYLFLGEEVSFMMRLKEIDKSESERMSKIDNDRFTFIEVPNFKSISNYFKYVGMANTIIDKAVSTHDVLVARLPSAIGTMAVKAARKHDVPYLVEYVGCAFDSLWNYNWKGKILAHYKMWQQKQLMETVPYTIYVTKTYLQNKYPTNGKSIHCSNVELQNSEQGNLIKRIGKIQNFDIENLVVGTVAAIDVPYKGQDDVIEAIGRLKKEGEFVNYKIVGNGSPERLNALISKHDVGDRVEIIGSLRHEKVFDFLNDIDLYIQPSKQEGLPRALIESMNQACPALGARTAGIPELLSEECIFKPGSITQIVEKIKLIDKDWLEREARKNFDGSKEYLKPILQLRRLLFYKEFLQESDLSVPEHLDSAITNLETHKINQL